MKTDFTTGAKILFLALLLGVGTAYVSADWVDAPCDTPDEADCNAYPPIHEGSDEQTKIGLLGLNDLVVANTFQFLGEAEAGEITPGHVLTAADENGNVGWAAPGEAVGGGESVCTSWECMKETYYVVAGTADSEKNWGLSPRAPNVTVVKVAANQTNYKTAIHFSCVLAGMGTDGKIPSPACRVARTQDGTFEIDHRAHDCLIRCADY